MNNYVAVHVYRMCANFSGVWHLTQTCGNTFGFCIVLCYVIYKTWLTCSYLVFATLPVVKWISIS